MILGVDVGGTFTDAALLAGDRLVTGKSPTTPGDQSEGVMAAVSEGASWGLFDYRLPGEGPECGFQSVPVDWRINAPRKRAFFNLLAEMTGSTARF